MLNEVVFFETDNSGECKNLFKINTDLNNTNEIKIINDKKIY